MEKVLRGSLLTFMTKIVTFALNLVIMILITRVLGVDRLGLYNYITLIPILAFTLLTPSIGTTNVYMSGQGSYPLDKLAGNSILSGLFFVVIVTLFIWLLTLIQPLMNLLALRGITLEYYWLGYASFPFTMFYYYMASIVRGTGRIPQFNLLTFLSVLSSLIVLSATAFFSDGTLTSFLKAYLLYSAINSLMAIVFVRRITRFTFRPDLPLVKEMMAYGWRAYLWNLFTFMEKRIDVILIGLLFTTRELSYYTNAVNIVEKMWFVPEALATVLFPYVSASSSLDEVHRLVTSSTRQIFLIMTVGAVLVGFVAAPLIPLVFKPEFGPSVPVLWLLLPGVVTLSVARIITIAFAGAGKPEMGGVSALIAFVMEMVLVFVLSPIWGLKGAALASSISYTFAMIVMVILYTRRMNVPLRDLFVFQKEDIRFYQRILRAGGRAKK